MTDAHPASSSPVRRELTARALLTGVVIGALLTPANVYAGLKIGWSFNLSITALLIGYAFWSPLTRTLGGAAWDRYESNISQTAASSAASIISGGLVAPIPAYLILTGDTLHLVPMTAWVFSVSFLGVWVAWYLRGALLSDPRLSFPVGVATAETIHDIFERGREAMLRCWTMGANLVFAGTFTVLDALVWTVPRFVPTRRLEQLTFGIDPSLLMLGFGALIGLRAGLSLLLGAVLAWGVLAPSLLAAGEVVMADAEATTAFVPLVEWLIWPGVSLMVATSLVSIVRWPRARWMLAGLRVDDGDGRVASWPALGLLGAAVLTTTLQIALFDVYWVAAVLAVPMAFVLAAVAARVVGETGIAPIGAIGKVAQVSFAVTAPGHATTNLMTANVAGGAAGQCADLLNDLKAGALIGANASRQVMAQCAGILTGSVVGSAVFVAMISHPAEQLLSAEWPAPAVAVWKAVAETLALGFDGVPPSARVAVLVAAVIGLTLPLLERRLGARGRWLPSGSSLGLAFVIPASTSFTLCAGALLAAALTRAAPVWSTRFLVACAAGLIAGESLFGVVLAIVGATSGP